MARNPSFYPNSASPMVNTTVAGAPPGAQASTLIQLCEPLFVYVCRLNRAARQGAPQQMQGVRNDLRAQMADLHARAALQPHLAAQFQKIRLPLVFFVDHMVRNSTLPFAMDWADLAADEGELAGDEKFFVLLDEALAEKGDDANERISIFLTCISLGFAGVLAPRQDELRQKAIECASRLRGRALGSSRAQICPEAYQSTDTSNLIVKPSSSLIGILIVFIGFIVVLVLTNIYLYKWSLAGLIDALKQIGPGAS